MAMVHNRVIAGGAPAMMELLKVPARFPDAGAQHISRWQDSAVAWWGNQDKHALMQTQIRKLPPNELQHFSRWVDSRDAYTTEKENAVLNEIRKFLDAR